MYEVYIGPLAYMCCICYGQRVLVLYYFFQFFFLLISFVVCLFVFEYSPKYVLKLISYCRNIYNLWIRQCKKKKKKKKPSVLHSLCQKLGFQLFMDKVASVKCEPSAKGMKIERFSASKVCWKQLGSQWWPQVAFSGTIQICGLYYRLCFTGADLSSRVGHLQI